MFDLWLFLEFLVWGWVGAIAHILVMTFAWSEKTYVAREFGLATVLAFVISQLHLPNSFVTFGLSFLGVDAIEGFLRRLVGEKE